MEEPSKTGYYSAKADSLFGHVVYKTPDGKLVKVTEVCEKKSESIWDDKILIGPITKFVANRQRKDRYDSFSK